MKKILAVAAFISGSFFIQPSAHAQVKVNINITQQPVWGPVGNDHVDFYYLPEVNCYYDVAKARFLYQSGNSWKSAKTLPAQYKKVDLYKTYKVVVNDPTPYKQNINHKKQYASVANKHDQPVIRDSKDSKYFENKNHPEHNNWEKQQKAKGKH